MRKLLSALACCAATLACLPANSLAATPQKVEWSDLVPKRAAAENPFARLSEADRADLRLMARERDSSRLGISLSDDAKAEAAQAAARLRERKVDATRLLVERDRLIRERETLLKSVVPELEGKSVSLAGYMLPLEFKGDKVSEFLLVPTVGACIHTPPPPPNQVVYVKPAEPVENKGRYAPVWISGALQTQTAKRELQLSDGATAVDTSYSMLGAEVKPYTKP